MFIHDLSAKHLFVTWQLFMQLQADMDEGSEISMVACAPSAVRHDTFY